MAGKLFILSAPSGTGKTTIRQILKRKRPEIAYSISWTTRERKEGEREKRDYFFVSEEKFKKNIKERGFIEWAKVYGNYYGTPARFIEENLKKGKNVLLTLDTQGALTLKRKYPKISILVALLPPSISTLERRLQKRKREEEKEMKKRLSEVEKELKIYRNYDYQVINKYLKETVKEIEKIIDGSP